jgi:Fe-S cluster biogenesis protein NfuA
MADQQDNDLKERVARVVAEEIGPAMQWTDAGIEVLGVDRGVVQVRLGGLCASCPSTLWAIIMELEQEIRKRIPEVEYLEAVP